jgi:hypothetical protein
LLTDTKAPLSYSTLRLDSSRLRVNNYTSNLPMQGSRITNINPFQLRSIIITKHKNESVFTIEASHPPAKNIFRNDPNKSLYRFLS